MARSTALQDFLTATETALQRVTGPGAEVAAQAASRWRTAYASHARPARLPVCDWITPALALQDGPLARAFARIEGQLGWGRRKSADPANLAFWDGHANAMILGPGGLEDREDVWVGATVMAPGVLYPDHNHPPAEVYLPLSHGQWWNAEMDWTDPGIGGFIYNPPGILHAMRAADAPFLALWILPI
jgi:prepilin-type processing-associated H-X9-DG protein